MAIPILIPHGTSCFGHYEFEPYWEIYRSYAKLTAQNKKTGTRSRNE